MFYDDLPDYEPDHPPWYEGLDGHDRFRRHHGTEDKLRLVFARMFGVRERDVYFVNHGRNVAIRIDGSIDAAGQQLWVRIPVRFEMHEIGWNPPTESNE